MQIYLVFCVYAGKGTSKMTCARVEVLLFYTKMIFFAEKFAQFKKKQYLCTRFSKSMVH